MRSHSLPEQPFQTKCCNRGDGDDRLGAIFAQTRVELDQGYCFIGALKAKKIGHASTVIKMRYQALFQ